MDKIIILFIMFIIYSICGWILETIYTSIMNKKKMERGFLIGPYCPIYGSAAIVMTLLLTRYNKDPLVLFVMATVLCSTLEYFTSYLMEKLFHARWWDYSSYKYNVEGRITLKNSLVFGILGVILILYINPFLIDLLKLINPTILITISIMLLIIFITDALISCVIIMRFKKVFDKVKADISEEANNIVREVINNRSIYSSRLLKAYPNLKIRTKKSVK